ncbi:MAG: PQQ-binding-like beta-propeller repeat protein, partial [Planctomycetes bacterium]|nr:PQQ-binding-like beta-propeller repeat protein [Planctomycetota bacterium]
MMISALVLPRESDRKRAAFGRGSQARPMRFDLGRSALWTFVVLSAFGTGWGTTIKTENSVAADRTLDQAATLVELSDRSGGFCSIVGAADLELAEAFVRLGAFQVHLLCPEERICRQLRRKAAERAIADRISGQTYSGGALPYTDNLLNLVVVESSGIWSKQDAAAAAAELFRVSAPLGTILLRWSAADGGPGRAIADQLRKLGAEPLQANAALAGSWLCFRKPWPDGIDEWTHYLHGPDGNAVANDRVVGPPVHLQWVGPPLWLRSHESDSSISTVVTARGRIFYICDEAPISLRGPYPLPDKWSLIARDAFNGALLWKVPIRRWGWREWKPSWFTPRPGDFPLDIRKRLVAVGDRVYVTLGYDAPITELDARTGRILKTYDGTEHASEILYVDGTLITSAPVGEPLRLQVLAIDAATGRIRWRSQKVYRGTTVDYYRWTAMHGKVPVPKKIYPAPNLATDGKVIALIDGPQLVGLDFQSGRELWRADFPLDERDQTAGRIRSQGNLWNGTMILADGVVLHASPYKLAGFDATTGRLLWSQPKAYIGHLWYEWKEVFVVDGLVWTWDANLVREPLETPGGQDSARQKGRRRRKQTSLFPAFVNAYDLHTGELKKKVPLGPIFKTHHHHRCYRNKATVRYILASRRGTEFVDLNRGEHTVHNWVRSTCHVGMMPANGLQYVPPHPCQCYIEEKLSGFYALASDSADWKPESDSSASRLVRGPAYGEGRDGPAPDPDADWPTFRHDNRRSGATRASVGERAERVWQTSIGRKVSAPIAVADRVFVALVDEHGVVCLKADSGRHLWSYFVGGRIDSPPTYARGRLLFGSTDGWVYCLRASDGALVWRFRAAPAERLVGAFDQFESAWPVHGSVLVRDDTVYFVAGRSSELDGGL